MKKYLLLALTIAVLVSAVIVIESDDSSADICDDVKVYILNEDGTYTKSTVNNVQTVKAAVSAAMNEQGRRMNLNLTSTNILSITDGYGTPDAKTRTAGTDQYWRGYSNGFRPERPAGASNRSAPRPMPK